MRKQSWAAVFPAGVTPFLFVFAIAAGMAAAPQPAAANPKYASIVIDHHTGRVLRARNADARRFPASLTKIMTLYMVFDALADERLSLSDRITVSARAAAMPPSKIGFKPGQTISVENAILALVTKSANDVAAAVGEHLAGSESAFAEMMTRKARAIGMTKTTFKNASGLPNRGQVTTARDMAALSRSIMVRHPEYYRYFSRTSFTYRGVRYGNHNRLLKSYRGTDGIKTGYIRASGFNLAASVRRGNKHLVAVVMGGKSGKSRNAHMTNILSANLSKAVASNAPPARPPGVMVADLAPPLPPRRPALPHDHLTATQIASIRKGAVEPAPADLFPISPAPAPAPAQAPVVVAQASTFASPQPAPVAAVVAAATPGPAPEPAGAVQIGEQPAGADAPLSPPIQLVPRGTIADARALATERMRSIQHVPVSSQVAAAGTGTPRPAFAVASIAPGELITGGRAPANVAAAAVPVANPALAAQPEPPDAVAASPSVLKPAVLESPFKDSWAIQIGAVGSEAEALNLLEIAKSRAPDILSNLHAFTEVTNKNRQTFHRARFAGFQDSSAAQQACNALKKQEFGCFAVRAE